MKISIAFVAIAMACLAISEAQVPGGPGAGILIGQEASINAVSIAINSALAKTDPTTLPPELQVTITLSIPFIFIFDLFLSQEELQGILASAELSLAACDDLLLTAPVWRYKICKFQELAKIRAQITQLKIKAAAAAAAAATSTANPNDDQPDV